MIAAPFALHTVPVDTRTGQAAGERWYIVPFRLWKYRTMQNQILRSWGYDRSERGRQFIGQTLYFAGERAWRNF